MNKQIKTIIVVVFVTVVLGGVYFLGQQRGKRNLQLLSEQRLEDLQQSISEQSSKIDDLHKESANSNKSTPSVNFSKIREERANQEQADCQQELSEYNACLSEYNSEMAEYNSCLTESSNPSSWRYKSYCSKPSNYCFKPVCAY